MEVQKERLDRQVRILFYFLIYIEDFISFPY
jgi:hypothetical protein